jgi:hypothetical protein
MKELKKSIQNSLSLYHKYNLQVNYRPILTSERVPNIKKPTTARQKRKTSARVPDGSPTPSQTDRLTLGRNLTSTIRPI